MGCCCSNDNLNDNSNDNVLLNTKTPLNTRADSNVKKKLTHNYTAFRQRRFLPIPIFCH